MEYMQGSVPKRLNSNLLLRLHCLLQNNSHENGTKHYALTLSRRAVLIINSNDKIALRAGTQRRKKGIDSLLYQEFDESGKLMNSHMMYNLRDVADFFTKFLNTEVCNEYCKAKSK
ncbi:hypothetical protein ABMA27_015396 [Loxostege sticticalis]|uniref:Uncharacterized protein n=1 Tax=Loxostege sticticalis TaxID=481309 RepID=A0ABR3I7H2_LOXSC